MYPHAFLLVLHLLLRLVLLLLLLLLLLQAGEFVWQLSLEALPGGREALPPLSAPLGDVARTSLPVANPTNTHAVFACSSSLPALFKVSPASIELPPHGSGEVEVTYCPSSVAVKESATLTVDGGPAGMVEYDVCGTVGSVCARRAVSSTRW